jgi:hypothetical protein
MKQGIMMYKAGGFVHITTQQHKQIVLIYSSDIYICKTHRIAEEEARVDQALHHLQ